MVVYDQLDNDPETSAVYKEIREFVRSDLTRILERGIAEGMVNDDLKIDDMLALLLGPIFYERLLGHSNTSDTLIEHLVQTVVHPAKI